MWVQVHEIFVRWFQVILFSKPMSDEGQCQLHALWRVYRSRKICTRYSNSSCCYRIIIYNRISAAHTCKFRECNIICKFMFRFSKTVEKFSWTLWCHMQMSLMSHMYNAFAYFIKTNFWATGTKYRYTFWLNIISYKFWFMNNFDWHITLVLHAPNTMAINQLHVCNDNASSTAGMLQCHWPHISPFLMEVCRSNW